MTRSPYRTLRAAAPTSRTKARHFIGFTSIAATLIRFRHLSVNTDR
ncbi:hypothetical protein [Streptomyces sp. NPDC018000]